MKDPSSEPVIMPVPRLYILGLATALVACGDTQGPSDNNDPGTNGPTVTTSVSVVDNKFNPPSNQVTTGQTVTWTWQGLNPHNVTFDNGSIGNSSTKSSGAFTRTFDSTGEFTYYCTVHGRGMSGKVTVVAPAN